MAEIRDILDLIQHIKGSGDNDVFVISGNSADYNWATAQDGVGLVIWQGDKFDVLHDVEEIHFDDVHLVRDETGAYQRVSATQNASDENAANEAATAEAVEEVKTVNITNMTQYVHGTSAHDVFEIDADSTGFGWGPTEDGKGLVIWNGSDFDILYDVETVRFNDLTLTLQEDGTYTSEQNETANEVANEATNETDDNSSKDAESVDKNETVASASEDISAQENTEENSVDPNETETANVSDDTQETTESASEETAADGDASNDSVDTSETAADETEITETVQASDEAQQETEAVADEGTADTDPTDNTIDTAGTVDTSETVAEDTQNTETTGTTNDVKGEPDNDGDGIADDLDLDDDNDGVLDVMELKTRNFERTTVDTIEAWEDLDIWVNGEWAPNTDLQVGKGMSHLDMHVGITFNFSQQAGETRHETNGVVEIPLSPEDRVKHVDVSFDALRNFPVNQGGENDAQALFELVDKNGNVVDSFEWISTRSRDATEINLSGTGEGLTLRVTDQSVHANGFGDDWTLRNLDFTQVDPGDEDALEEGLIEQLEFTTAEAWQTLDIKINGEDATAETLQIGHGFTRYEKYTGVTFNFLSANGGTRATTEGPVEISLGEADKIHQMDLSFEAYRNHSYSGGEDDINVLFELVDATGAVLDSFEWTSDRSREATTIEFSGRGENLTLRVTDQSTHGVNWSDDWTLGNLKVTRILLEDTDSDGDGIIDRFDLDSDNDGITDNVEAQNTFDFKAPSGTDANGNGLDDIYEGEQNRGITPVDSDDDGIEDRIDTNSDNDKFSDAEENGLSVSAEDIAASGDQDQDGLLDVFEGSDTNDGYNDPNDENFNNGEFLLPGDPRLNSDGSNATDTINLDFREQTARIRAEGDPEADTDIVRIHTGENSATVDVLANDFDVEGGELQISAINGQSINAGSPLTVADIGLVTLTEDGQLHIEVEDGFTAASFEYTVVNENGASDIATVEVSPNSIPITVMDSARTSIHTQAHSKTKAIININRDKDTAVIDVLENDFDPDGDALRITDFNTDNLRHGTVEFNEEEQNFTFTQTYVQTGYAGRGDFRSTSFTYTVSDDYGGSQETSVQIDYTGQYSSPIALDLSGDGQIGVTGETTSYIKDWDAEIGRTVDFDIDGDGDLEAIEWFDGSGDGILIDNRDGNAAIDMNGSRLFGDEGGLYNHGYEKLALLDEDGDGSLTQEELTGLALWIDDGDAIVEDGELQTLADHEIAEISVQSVETTDSEDRVYIQSHATREDGSIILTEDVWFASGEEEIDFTENDADYNMEIRFFETDYAA